MKNPSTDSHKETPEEREKRIDAMLKCMVVETLANSIITGKSPPRYTRQQVADFCGCSKDHIRRIEQSAWSKIRRALADQ